MFAELNYAKTINRFKGKSNKQRVAKHDETWKRAKNIAIHKQSRRENEYDEESLLPEQHLSRWEQHHQEHLRKLAFPLGPGW